MLNSLMHGDIRSFIISLLLSLPIVFLSLSVHETAHGWALTEEGFLVSNAVINYVIE